MVTRLPIELWIRIALSSPHGPHGETDEHMFNSLVRAVPDLGRWTIGVNSGPRSIASATIDRRLDLMLMFGYSVEFTSWTDRAHRTRNVVVSYSCIVWTKNGQTHRNDGPAVVGAIGDLYVHDASYILRYSWQYHGQPHRIDGPSSESLNLDRIWSQHGELYRDNGPATMRGDYVIEWYPAPGLHRTDGPAVIGSHGDVQWFIEYKRHRIDGPASIYRSGDCVFYLHGVKVPQ